MTKATLSSPSGSPSQPGSHQGYPNAGQDDDNLSISSQQIRKRDMFVNMFRSSSPKPKATNSQCTGSKSTIIATSTSAKDSNLHLPCVSTPASDDFEHMASTTAVKSPSSNEQSLALPAKPRLDVFPQNVKAPAMNISVPEFGARIETTPQLALCIGLLSKDGDHINQLEDSLPDMLCDTAGVRAWCRAMKQDPTERDRLFWLGTRMVDEFAKDALKDSTEIAEMVHIGPVLDREHFRSLLSCIITAFDQSVLLDVNLLQGLAQLVQSAPPNSLVADDLVRILGLLRVRLQDKHQQTSVHPYHLTLTVSRLLDVMADHKVKDLSRVEEYEPLSGVFSCLSESSDPYLMYQACYAFQALQYVPDDETVLQTVLRHSTGVVDGLVKVTAVCKLDLGAVLEGLGKLQKVLESTVEVAEIAREGASTLMESGRGTLDSLKEGYRSGKKRPWYVAVRAANVLAQAGQLRDLNRLICEAPCRSDLLFQWGICQLLGEIASDDTWDTAVRQQALELLGELYNSEWAQHENVRTYILRTIDQLGILKDQAICESSRMLLKNLRHEQAPATGLPYPLRNRLALPTSSPILARVHKIPPLEYDLHQLQVLRLEQRQLAVYIPPMAKSSLKAKDKDLFSLMEKTQVFLASERQVMLVLGDSGAGKSTFNRHLEHHLWTEYKKGGPIPLFIDLPAIDRPDQDMVSKQLKSHSFSDDQILEIKLHRQLILICDAYDESQMFVNLHRTNSLNRPGQWNTKMIITCRTQFLGPDYHSRFVPQGEGGHYAGSALNLFQEAVIAPFSKEQIEKYVNQYVPLEPRTWSTQDYIDRLITIPNLLDLVRNPFLLSLALEALPGVTEGKQDLSTIKITRVQLYDTFVNHWFDVNKRRLESNNALSTDDRDILDELVTEGFTSLGLDYSTRLALAIFERQDGNPVVKYSHFSDKNTWKAEFFGPQPEVRLLRQSSPLARAGNRFRFVHRSMLEYFLSRAIYSPDKSDDEGGQEAGDESIDYSSLLLIGVDGPLFQRNLIGEPSIIQFLSDRVKTNSDFEPQLRAVIDQSKTDADASTAAANAITVLVKADVDFNGADFRGVKISGADVSEGQFDSAQFQGADLTGANLSRTWLRQANLSNAQMNAAQFGESPYLEMDSTGWGCAYSPDGTLLAVALEWDGLDVYNTATWKRVLRIRDKGICRSVAFSCDSQQIILGYEYWVRLFNCTKGEEVLAMAGHTGFIYSVANSPCEMLLASAGVDRTVRLWNSQTGESRFVLEGHTKSIASVRFSSNGRQLVSGSWDGTIRFWDPKTGEPGLVLESLLGAVECLDYSHDGRWIVSGHYDGALQLWDVVAGEPGPVLRGHDLPVSGIAFSWNDQWVASSSYDHTVRLWDSSTGVCVAILTGHRTAVRDVAFSPDGIQLASAGEDRRVRLWDISSVSWSVEEHHVGQVKKAMYSVKGLLVFSKSSRTIRQWDPVAGMPGPFVFTIPEDTEIDVAIVSPDGNQIAVSIAGGLIQLWDYRTGTLEFVLEGHKSDVVNILYSPCGRWLLARDRISFALLWYLPDMKQELQGRAEVDEKGFLSAFCAAFSSSGRQIAISDRDDFVHFFDLPSRNLVKSKKFQGENLQTLVYSPNGQQLALGWADGSIYLWNVDQSHDEEFSATLRGYQSRILSVAYSSCGQWIVSGSEDRTVRLWNRLPEGSESWACVATVSSFFDRLYEIACSPVIPGEFATHCADGSIRTWRVSNDGGKVVVKMQRGSNLRTLYAEGLVLKDTIGLSPINQKLLVQRGAADSSLTHEGDALQP